MTDIDIINIFKDRKIINPFIKKSEEIQNYLKTRYTDIPEELFSYKEVIYRIQHKIDVRPVCPVCGKPVVFIGDFYLENVGKTINGYRKSCSKACSYQNIERNKNVSRGRKMRQNAQKQAEIEKRKQTCLEKYGFIYAAQNDDVKQKIYNTMIQRYGGYTLQSDILKNKVKQTNLKKYGVINVFAANVVKEKIKNTNIQRYNVWHYNQSEIGRRRLSELSKLNNEKRYNTNLSRYGTKYLLNNHIIANKRLKTLHLNKNFKYSREENLFYELLVNLYGENNIIRQYKSTLYPFNCDFYIKTIDLYIEYNGHYTHMDHPFNKDNINDQNILNMLISKGYNNVVKVWSELDVKKLNILKNNNLRFLFLYNDWNKDWKSYIKSKYKDLYKNKLITSLQNMIANC